MYEQIKDIIKDIMSSITIVESIWKWRKKYGSASVGLMILCILSMGRLWYLGYSIGSILCGFAVIVFCGGSLVFVLANYRKKQFKQREIAIYQDIIETRNEKLFQETQKIAQEWIEQWDEGVKKWEDDILKIKCLIKPVKAKGYRPSIIQGVCFQGYANIFPLYQEALKVELTAEHYKKINERVTHSMGIDFSREVYLKTVQLMKENGIIDEECEDSLAVDFLANKKRHKSPMLLLHWWLHVIDDAIIDLKIQQEEEKSKSVSGKQEANGSCQDNIFTNREYEEIEKILHNPDSLSWEYKSLLYDKRDILSLLHDISDTYKAARETFIHYKKLIDAVKEGYIAFNEDCLDETVKDKFDEYKELDKDRKKDFPVFIGIPTFEKAYKLGVIEWMKGANNKFDHQLAFWNKLIKIENAKKKLQIIWGEKKVKALEERIEKDQKQVTREFQEAIAEGKGFFYDQSCLHFISHLEN